MFEHKGFEISVEEITPDSVYYFRTENGYNSKVSGASTFYVASCKLGRSFAGSGPEAVDGAKRLIDAQT